MPIPDEPLVQPHPDPWVDDRGNYWPADHVIAEAVRRFAGLYGPIHLGHALLAAIDEWQLERLKEMPDADPR